MQNTQNMQYFFIFMLSTNHKASAKHLTEDLNSPKLVIKLKFTVK